MGSTTFIEIGIGASARQAYSDARERANDENGHQQGYSGDIQTSDGFKMLTSSIDDETPIEAAVRLTDNLSSIQDSRGRCGCIDLLEATGEDADKDRYLFFGWAAC
tara:strand:- start:466 stop:783 length:318 start_codon:yes stop_codon:yes gene_type:complete